VAEILLTTEEVAARLGVTPRMVRYRAEPELHKVLIGNRLYFRESEVSALLQKADSSPSTTD
jgi:hypothetical protein